MLQNHKDYKYLLKTDFTLLNPDQKCCTFRNDPIFSQSLLALKSKEQTKKTPLRPYQFSVLI